MRKSVGRTVRGVRIGCQALSRCCLKAVSERGRGQELDVSWLSPMSRLCGRHSQATRQNIPAGTLEHLEVDLGGREGPRRLCDWDRVPRSAGDSMAVSPRANLLARTPFPERSYDRKLPATRRVALQGDPARLDTGPSKRRGSVRRPHGLTKRSATPQGGGGERTHWLADASWPCRCRSPPRRSRQRPSCSCV
jgi:hypothetical protein